MHFLLQYELAPDYLARRPTFRQAHLTLAWQAAQRGELVLAGAVGDPVEGALLLFQCETPAAAERFASADPYVANGLVVRWRVLPWATVAGPQAAMPVMP